MDFLGYKNCLKVRFTYDVEFVNDSEQKKKWYNVKVRPNIKGLDNDYTFKFYLDFDNFYHPVSREACMEEMKQFIDYFTSDFRRKMGITKNGSMMIVQTLADMILDLLNYVFNDYSKYVDDYYSDEEEPVEGIRTIVYPTEKYIFYYHYNMER